jgi:chromosomal replication initiator protein
MLDLDGGKKMSEPLKQHWQTACDMLRDEMPHVSFETWVGPLTPIEFTNNTLLLKVESDFNRNILVSHYIPLIQNAFGQVINQACDVELLTPDEINGALNKHQSKNKSSLSILNPKYTFDSFVIGNSNRFAHAACLAVAEAPARAYNPLFLYGGVGLGKTHLMMAIGHFVRSLPNELNVLYVTSEEFTNQLINSIRTNDADNFRSKYRKVDVLLIDDIQFIAGKERTQEEFFHTFNALYESNKQIILSSDRPPREMVQLEERLQSRFQWGLIADIQPPDLETRIAILRKKADNENLPHISDDVLEFIATKAENNIRELEGCLTRIIAYSRLTKENITIDLVSEALKEIIKNTESKRATPEHITKLVCDRFSITTDDLLSKKRNRDISYPRQISMYLLRELTDLSLSAIGKFFGGRDHTTVLHAYRTISGEMAENNELRVMLADIRNQVNKK